MILSPGALEHEPTPNVGFFTLNPKDRYKHVPLLVKEWYQKNRSRPEFNECCGGPRPLTMARIALQVHSSGPFLSEINSIILKY